MTPKVSRLRKVSPSKLRKECTYLWGLVVRQRDNHTCQWCGKPGNQPHHIICRASGNLARFTVNNGVCLCFFCHIRRIPRDPIGFTEFIQGWLKERNIDYDDMKRRFKEIKPLKLHDYQIIKANLEYLLKGNK